MTRGQGASLLHSIHRLFRQGTTGGLAEGTLVERFVTLRDEAAFETLVARHGPMVFGVCRRMLHDPRDVEDAFQATFLVLVRKAGTLRDRDLLGPWLHGVARRVAARARTVALQRQEREAPGLVEEAAMTPGRKLDQTDVSAVIDEEIARLPERYRAPVILCDLEGHSYLEAAERLCCPVGTIQSRLSRGRRTLRSRLARRGLEPGAAFMPGLALPGVAPGTIPQSLIDATVARAAVAAAGTVGSDAVLRLVEEALKAMSLTKWKAGGGAALTVVILLGASLLTHAVLSSNGPIPRGAAQEPDGELPKGLRILNLKVVSADDPKPLAGASVWVRATRGRAHNSVLASDARGRCPIPLPGESIYVLHVVVASPGYVPIELRWDGSNIPDAYTLALDRGATIGGTLRDEKGQPVPDAQVMACVTNRPPKGHSQLYPTMGKEVAATSSDPQGRWRSSSIPEGLDAGASIEVRVTHPEFVASRSRLTVAAARALTGVQVMKRGSALSGTVLDTDGRPLAGAMVLLERRSGGDDPIRLETDKEGRFRFGSFLDPQRGEQMLAVRAKGFAAAVRKLILSGAIPPQVIRLAAPRPLQGRVVDSKGRAVAGAVVSSTNGLGAGPLEWETETDRDGRFEWAEAPASGTVSLDVYKPSFERALGRQVTAGANEIEITLHRPLHIHGTVSDAGTGRPIDQFVLIPGWGPDRPGSRPEWLRSEPSARSLIGGRFDLTGLFPDQGLRRSIRIEADGYLPAELLGFRDDVEEIDHEFKLRQAATLTGIVRDANGRPVEGVDVALSSPANHAQIKNGRLVTNLVVGNATHVRTGPDGRYRFRPQEERVGIVAVHDAGFAVRSAEKLETSGDVTLVSWGRIEGVMRIGSKPAVSKHAAAWTLDAGLPWGRIDYDTETDAEGRFVMERVTPCRMTVYRYVTDQNNRGWTPSNPVNAQVEAGRTAHVEVGGTGRAVVGRLALPDGVALSELVAGHGNLSAVRPPEPKPIDFPDWSNERKSAWYTAFYETRDGKDYRDSERKYAVELAADGSFRIEDVPAGRYSLRLPFEGRSRGDQTDRLASVRAEVVVPEMPGGRDDEPLDIGSVSVSVFPLQTLEVGDPAPAVVHGAADGRPLDLGGHHGKWVLLVFWATYDRQSIALIPSLKATNDAFGRDPRFRMIGLSMGLDAQISRRYAALHGLTWEEHDLGVSDDPSPVAAAFGVRYPPQVILVDPDGKIAAKGLEGDEILRTVTEVLKSGRK